MRVGIRSYDSEIGSLGNGRRNTSGNDDGDCVDASGLRCNTYSLSAPVSLTTNYFHFIALTYSATNVSIYWDSQLLTNDHGGLSIWPDSEIVSNGVYFGSDTNGQMQAAGLFNLVASYN